MNGEETRQEEDGEEYIKELSAKLKRGELSSKEALKGLKERGLFSVESNL